MFRGPKMLAWTCPIRPLLVLRETHLAAFLEYTEAGWLKERRYESICEHKQGSPLSPKTVTCSTRLSSSRPDCENHQLQKASFHNLQTESILSSKPQPSQVTVSLKDKMVSSSWKPLLVENLDQNVKVESISQDCLFNTTCLQPWKRTSLSFPSKTRPQNNFIYRQLFFRPFSTLTEAPRILNHFQRSSRPSSLSFHETRVHYQTAPQVADKWQHCLSLENENRCRKILGPNYNLYSTNKGTKWAGNTEEKNQVKWASVLVSLCSVQGEPAFLFTLRSSMLKGRHKGDVSFAGGKWDPSDTDVVATALREAREELGVNVATERVWGMLKPLRDRSGMLIAPVLANLGPLEELSFKPNPEEVEEIFTLSLSHLCDPQNRGYTHFRVGDKYAWTFPVFRNGKHRVWGLTAIALDQTLKLIVPP